MPSPGWNWFFDHRLSTGCRPVQHHLQVFARFLAQENLARVQVQVFHHLGERLVQDPVDIR